MLVIVTMMASVGPPLPSEAAPSAADGSSSSASASQRPQSSSSAPTRKSAPPFPRASSFLPRRAPNAPPPLLLVHASPSTGAASCSLPASQPSSTRGDAPTGDTSSVSGASPSVHLTHASPALLSCWACYVRALGDAMDPRTAAALAVAAAGSPSQRGTRARRTVLHQAHPHAAHQNHHHIHPHTHDSASSSSASAAASTSRGAAATSADSLHAFSESASHASAIGRTGYLPPPVYGSSNSMNEPRSPSDELDDESLEPEQVDTVESITQKLAAKTLLSCRSAEFDAKVDMLKEARSITYAELKEIKRQRRVIRNRESAFESRKRQKAARAQLATEMDALRDQNTWLRERVRELERELNSLRNRSGRKRTHEHMQQHDSSSSAAGIFNDYDDDDYDDATYLSTCFHGTNLLSLPSNGASAAPVPAPSGSTGATATDRSTSSGSSSSARSDEADLHSEPPAKRQRTQCEEADIGCPLSNVPHRHLHHHHLRNHPPHHPPHHSHSHHHHHHNTSASSLSAQHEAHQPHSPAPLDAEHRARHHDHSIDEQLLLQYHHILPNQAHDASAAAATSDHHHHHHDESCATRHSSELVLGLDHDDSCFEQCFLPSCPGSCPQPYGEGINLIDSLIVDDWSIPDSVPVCGMSCGLENCRDECVIPSNMPHTRHICAKPVLCVSNPTAPPPPPPLPSSSDANNDAAPAPSSPPATPPHL